MATSRKPPLLTRIGETIMSIDKYGESASFNIAGKRTYPSVYGTFISILIFAVVIPYGTNKFMVMQEREGTDHQRTLTKKGLNSTEIFE